MVDLSLLLPEGYIRLRTYRRRFRALGLPASWSFRRDYREALEVSQVELLPDPVSPMECVVDVGANVGRWSAGISRLTRISKLIAFEPVPDVFHRLRLNTAAFPHIQCVQAAVGASVGQVVMNVERMSELSSVLPITREGRRFHDLDESRQERIVVPVTTLDDALREYDEISLLKLDVQGYEAEVLKGAHRTLKRTRVLMTEVLYAPYYQGASAFDDLYRLITSIAPFRLRVVSDPKRSAEGLPLWADAVFVLDEIPAG
jgi:FkbM family methyltransferase